MSTNKRDIIVQLIEFMIDQYYNFLSKNIVNSELILEQTLSVLHTSILAHKNSIPSKELLAKICQLVDYHIRRFGI